MIDAGAQVASFAQAPTRPWWRVATRPAWWSCRPSGPGATPRRWPAGASTPSSPRGPRAAATPARSPPPCSSPQVVDAVGDQVAVLGAGGYFDGRGLVAALAYGASGIAMGTRFLLTAESRVPDAVKASLPRDPGDRHGGHHQGRRRPPAGHPHRAGRPPRRASWLRNLPRALRQRPLLPQESRTVAASALLKEGRAMKDGNELTWSQVVMAANAPVMTKAALVEGAPTSGCCRPARSSGVIEELPTVAELIGRIVTGPTRPWPAWGPEGGPANRAQRSGRHVRRDAEQFGIGEKTPTWVARATNWPAQHAPGHPQMQANQASYQLMQL